jgi:CRP-like cAMP-binding protein
MAALLERPEWWRHFLQPALTYGDVSNTVAADLLIRDSERRCAAVLLRLSGRRFAGPDDSSPVEVPLTQDDLAGAANLSCN